MIWNKTQIKNENGESVEAICPVIISASRSTDIPAFYSKWFINRLESGYIKWVNPFNQKPQYISFQQTRLIVFWTKNADPLIARLSDIDERSINYYFQFTVNDYVAENFEKNVPPLNERIDTFIKLSELIGKEKVIWRFDPLVFTDKLGVQELLSKIEHVGNQLYKYTEKFVFSFADINAYKKVQNNLSKDNIPCIEASTSQIEAIAKGLSDLNKKWKLDIATCAEAAGLDSYGIKHNKCIDDELIIRTFKKDKLLMYFLGYEENLFSSGKKFKTLKDKGQRKECGCIVSKDIGMYNTCPHLCVYCYANSSAKVVLNNSRKHLDNSESIV